MNGFTRTPSHFEAQRLLWVGVIVLGSGFSQWNRAQAAAIHHNDESSLIDRGSLGSSWSEYLMSGPSEWKNVAHPALTQAIEAAMWKNIRTDPPPESNAVVNFFEYKQSLDPARFDHYHPRIAKALAKLEAQIVDPATTPTTTTSPTVQPQQLTPSSISTVPEPTTLLLAIGMTGYALWWRRRHT